MASLLTGRSALVTGGTRGIGAAVAARLAELGAEVAVTGRGATDSPPPRHRVEPVDFTDLALTERFATRVSEARIDILVNNAGINVIAPFEQIDPADFDRIHRVNLRAPLLLCRAVLPYMRGQRWGRIVNVASIFGVVSKAQRGSYSSSKFGLDGLTAALAAEVAADGVLANCVSPGFIDTELTRSILSSDQRADLARQVPAQRFGTVEEVARFVGWLVSPENTYISGQNLVIDGGFSRV